MNAMEMNVRFLYFEGCPNAGAALQRLKKVLQKYGISGDVELVEISSPENAKAHHFLGSPTIQINGLDIEKERRADPPLFGCRVYEGKEGRTGVPPKEMITRALEEAMEGG